jgi:hypothetical protein
MDGTKYIGMDVQKEARTIARDGSTGKLVMESTVEMKADTIATNPTRYSQTDSSKTVVRSSLGDGIWNCSCDVRETASAIHTLTDSGV